MRKLKFLLLMAVACSVLVAAIATIVYSASYNVRYNFSVVDEDGVPIGSNKIVVQVYSAGTTTAATLYDSAQNDSLITPPFTTEDGDISFWGGDRLYDFLIYDSPVLTTQIKRTSVAPTTHRILFPQLATYNPILMTGGLQEFTDEDTDPVVTGSFYKTGTTTATINNFLSGAALSEAALTIGQVLVVQSKGAITFDVTSSGLIGGSTDIVTAAGDMTTWIYDGTSWDLLYFMDLSDNLN
jgi:hypothetical protein